MRRGAQETAMPADQYFTARDLCGRLKINRVTLWRWVRDGRVPAPVKFGRRLRWIAAEISNFERGLSDARVGAGRV
jgi:predicted DNA-binding transcriptional regulator AlpA